MASSYAAYLQMKTIFTDFSSAFFDKLTDVEKKRFQELVKAADSLKPQKVVPKKIICDEENYLQPKSIFFCLGLKKLFSRKSMKFMRYSFALIRCLYKDAIRVEIVKDKKRPIRKTESLRTPIKAKKKKQPVLVTEENEDEVEDFVYLERKNTKMTKTKKVLLRSTKNTQESIQKISKNHSWVLAFALIKWKKIYFSSRSDNQRKQDLSVLVSQLLVSFNEKYKKKLVKLSFEQVKVRYFIISKNNYLKIWLVVKNLSTVMKNQKKMQLFETFRILNSLRKKKVSFFGPPISSQPKHTKDRKMFMFHNLKKLQKNIEIKHKITAFVAIQNFQNENNKFIYQKHLKRMCALVQKLLFIKKYLYFFEIKEEVYIKYKKLEFLSESIERIQEKSCKRLKRLAFMKTKLLCSSNTEILVKSIEKTMARLLQKESFDMIFEYSTSLNNFLVLRNYFTSSLMTKIYYKRMSSSFLKWGSYAQDLAFAEELGLLTPSCTPIKPGSNQEVSDVSEYHYFSESSGKSYGNTGFFSSPDTGE